jgi:hypothetical protein
MGKNILKQKEAKTLTLTVTRDGSPVDLSGCTLFLGVKHHKDDTQYTFSKNDADFDKSQTAQGVVSVFLSGDDLDQDPGDYVAELKVQFSGSPAVIDKSADFYLLIQQAVT